MRDQMGRIATSCLTTASDDVRSGLGTTKIHEADRFDEDSASVADLVAGASPEVPQGMLTSCGKIPKEPRPFLPDQISRKSDLISDWFSSHHGLLRKYGVVISMVTPGHYRIGAWRVDDAVIYVP